MLNHIDIIGRVIREPELRVTPNGVSTVTIAVAVERDSNQRDERGYRLSDIFNCIAWRQTADYVGKYIHKGDFVGVSGRLQIRSYTDRDGNRRDSVEISADNVYSVGNRRDADGNGTYGGNADNGYGNNSGYNRGNSNYGGNSSNFGGYDAPSSVHPASSGFQELGDDDGELPF